MIRTTDRHINKPPIPHLIRPRHLPIPIEAENPRRARFPKLLGRASRDDRAAFDGRGPRGEVGRGGDGDLGDVHAGNVEDGVAGAGGVDAGRVA